jgi:2'-hydroxyisoflavone reductase
VNRFLNEEESRTKVAAPDSPEYPTQAIDVRDLASWIVTMVVNGESGIFNSVLSYTLGECFEGFQKLSKTPKEIHWIPNERLTQKGIRPFSQYPLWVPEAMKGLVTADCSKALARGLKARPIHETIQDTANWLQKIGPDAHNELMKSFWAPVGGNVTIGLDSQTELDLIQ